MSTRATYLFKAKDWTPEVCFYIHHDGYEAGAAEYFYKTISQYNNITPESFIRANKYAEFTGDHDSHGDTEYHYTIDGNNLVVKSRSAGRFITSFNGTVAEFINNNINKNRFSKDEPFSTAIIHLNRLTTEKNLSLMIESITSRA